MHHVIVRLRNGHDIMGILKNENDKGVDIGDACVVRYHMSRDGSPAIALIKYCTLSKSFDVWFKRDMIAQIFYDPIDELVSYYNKNLRLLKSSYERQVNHIPESYHIEQDDIESSDEQEILLAMEELYYSNTVIQ